MGDSPTSAAPPPELPGVPTPPVNVARSASIVSAAVALSRVSGLVREMVMARLFGASLAYDAFLLAFRIPNLARDLFAEGALSSAFVPKFSEYLNTRSREEAARLAQLVATAIILIVGALCLLGSVFAEPLVGLFAPGFHQVPGKFELAVRLTRILFPFLLLVALAAQAMGVLNALNHFGIPALSSAFFNLGSVVFGLLFALLLSPVLHISQIEGMTWGVLLGGALQLCVQLPLLWREGFSFRPLLDWGDEGLQHILRLMGPAILGSAAVQINVMVNTSFAADVLDPVRLHDGPVSWLGYAFRFMQLPLGLFGVAIASATLPAISRSAHLGRMDEFRRTLSRSLGLVFLLTVPSSVGLVLLGRSMVAAVYQGGSFNAYDTQQTALALSGFAIGLAGYSAVKVLTPAFYALNDARTPMLVSAMSVAVNYLSALSLLKYARLGHEALAITTSAVALFGFFMLFWLLRGRLGGMYGRELRSSTAKIIGASAAMGVVVWFSSSLLHQHLGSGRLAALGDLAINIPLGAAIFYLGCRLLKVEELEVATRTLAGPLRRLNPFARATIR